MDLKDLTGRILDELYSGLTGGSAELPLPANMTLQLLWPGLAMDPSLFYWAIAGPYAGPTPLTLDYFRELVETIQGDNPGMDRAAVIDDAKLMYQQLLLGGWEMWCRLVDFVPMSAPTQADTQWKAQSGQGKFKHVGVVYGQAGQTLSKVYQDTLERCWVAAEPLTQEQKDTVDRMRVLLQEEVQVEDFLTGKMRTEIRESRLMTVYKEKQIAYENAVIDYAVRLAQANYGTAADLVAWSRSGGIYKQRANRAMADWIATGYKNDVENAQATINQILGTNMVAWVDKLKQDLVDIENNVSGAFGYPFFPAAVLPGTFALSQGWTKFEEMELHKKISSSATSRDWTATAGIGLGFFNFAGGAGGGHKEEKIDFTEEKFGIEFEYTQVEIVRPAFNPNFFLSRGWKPKDSFIVDYGPLHSDGKPTPTGAMIGYPTKALFIRNLSIYSSDLARVMETKQDDIRAGGTFSIGPICVGGTYRQADREGESNVDIHGAKITVQGMQLVAFLSALFPYTANPSPDVTSWI